MVTAYTPRPTAESLAERKFLARRLAEVERGLGRVAAVLGTPTPITQPLDVLDRARELTGDLVKQVQVIPLEEAITAHLAWLERAEARLAEDDGEPKVALDRIDLDRRLLGDLLVAWQAARQ